MVPKASEITSILAGAKFNPKTDRILGIVSKQGNLDYYEREMIVKLETINTNADNLTHAEYELMMRSVIRNAVLAIHYSGIKEKLNGANEAAENRGL